MQGFSPSGWPDLNRRPLDPQSSALTNLRHSPFPYVPTPVSNDTLPTEASNPVFGGYGPSTVAAPLTIRGVGFYVWDRA